MDALTRAEVEDLLASGVPWTIRFCGDELPSKAGVGTVNFPSGVVNHIPTPAALRKLRRGTASKTYFHATLNDVAGSRTLELVEG